MSAASGSNRPANRRLAIGILLIVAAGALWMATRGRDSRPEDQPLRDPITLPSPSPEEKVA